MGGLGSYGDRAVAYPNSDFGGKKFKIEIDSSILAGRNSK
jgi:hypothetical protein